MTPDPLSLCTSWTEDDGVFAVLGVFIDFSGQGQLCLTKDHETIHIGHELEQPWIDQSPPGLLLTPDTTKEGAAATLVNLLVAEKKLKGAKVGFLADQDSEARIDDVVIPALKKAKVKTGSSAVLSISDPGHDGGAGTARQLHREVEEREGQHRLHGRPARLGEAVRAEDQGRDARRPADHRRRRHRRPGPGPGRRRHDAEPVRGHVGDDRQRRALERWANKNALLQQCVDIYEEATGTTVPAPDQSEVNSKGKTVELSIAVTDFCGELFMFRDIAEKVGPNLTIKNWQKTVTSSAPIDLVPTDIASLCKGKYAADDAARLVEFSSKAANGTGDWEPATDIADASGGKCTAKT